MTYIDPYSWKCLLGRQSKDITEVDGLYRWQVGKRAHMTTARLLTVVEIEALPEINFHYLSPENLNLVKSVRKVQQAKQTSTRIVLTQLSTTGNKHKSLRHALNRAKTYNLTVENNFRKLSDVEEMLEEWSTVLAAKYFRDNSGKNLHFYRNNWHADCHNVFLYDQDKLVAFGTASPGVGQYCSYVMGKSLCNRYYGLSELADYSLFDKCLGAGLKTIDLGQTSGGMTHYKNKFAGAENYTHYNGKINGNL